MSIYPNLLYYLHIYPQSPIYQSPNISNKPPLINLSRSQNNKLITQLALINFSLNNSINPLSRKSSSITDPCTKIVINSNKYEITNSGKSNVYLSPNLRYLKMDQYSRFTQFYQSNSANQFTKVFTPITIIMNQSKSGIQIQSQSKLHHKQSQIRNGKMGSHEMIR